MKTNHRPVRPQKGGSSSLAGCGIRLRGGAWHSAVAPLAVVLALGGISRGAEQGAATPAATQEGAAAKVAIESRLKSIVLPVVDFDNVTLEEAVEFLRTQSKALDTATPGEGVNLAIRRYKGTSQPRVTVKMKDAPLGEVIVRLARLTDMAVRINAADVTLVPKDAAGSAAPAPGAVEASKLILIGEVNISEEPLETVVAFLNRESAAQKGPLVVIGEGLDPQTPVKDLMLRGTTLSEVVSFLTGKAGCRCVATEDSLKLLPR